MTFQNTYFSGVSALSTDWNDIAALASYGRVLVVNSVFDMVGPTT